MSAERTLDLLTFVPPPGWHVEHRGSGAGEHVVMSRADAASYCMIVVYTSTPASGDLSASFASEWGRVALKTLDPVAIPRAAVSAFGDVRVAIGAASSTQQSRPLIGLLVVVDAGTRVVPILVAAPSFESFDSYRPEVDPFLGSLAVRVAAAPAIAPVTPVPRLSLAIADLAGDWGRHDGINTRYVDRQTGAYAGTDSIHFTETWAIGADGGVSLDFYGIQNGRRIVEKATGTATLTAEGILAIRMTNEKRYVLRGWDDAPDMTVMTLNGPWYDAIPPEILANPAHGANLDQRWVRLRKGPR
jgi:hypothetical protein